MRVLIIHGPNLNLLGERPSQFYGSLTLAEINEKLHNLARKKEISLDIFQKQGEGEIVQILHDYRKLVDGVIINPAAYTHSSIAIRDAIEAIALPCVEVHLSDIYRREDFRRKSFIKDVCLKQFVGEGVKSYLNAVDYIWTNLSN